jgi:hypothetical protein
MSVPRWGDPAPRPGRPGRRRRRPGRRGRADRRPGGGGREDGAVGDVPGGIARRDRPGVVGLRQPPEVVVAPDHVVAVADADLRVERPAPAVPHLVQPGEPVPGLGRQGAVAAPGRPLGRQQQRGGVAGCLGELQVVAGVEPAALDVHRAALLRQAAHQHVVRGVHRGDVHRGVPVCEVRRLAVQDPGDLVGAVPLGLEEAHRPVDVRPVELRGPGDPEGGGRGRRRTAHDDPVGAGGPHGRQVERVDRRVARVPRPSTGPARAGQDHTAPGVDHREPGAAAQAAVRRR